jgi:hypothetical protein
VLPLLAKGRDLKIANDAVCDGLWDRSQVPKREAVAKCMMQSKPKVRNMVRKPIRVRQMVSYECF